MKTLVRSLVVLALLATASPGALAAPAPAPDAAALETMLREFLHGASTNDAAAHDRFWADDLIYTGSSGRRIGKADIMRDVRESPPPKPTDPATTYMAEDVRIQQYGDAAVVAFRLVGTTQTSDRTSVQQYLNTGTFVKRGGVWKVVAWQATKMPQSAEDARGEVTAAEAAFRRALAAQDAPAIEALTEDGFVWRHGSAGQKLTRDALLEHLRARHAPEATQDSTGASVAVFGDAAIVSGASCTRTYMNHGDGWKAIAMRTDER